MGLNASLPERSLFPQKSIWFKGDPKLENQEKWDKGHIKDNRIYIGGT